MSHSLSEPESSGGLDGPPDVLELPGLLRPGGGGRALDGSVFPSSRRVGEDPGTALMVRPETRRSDSPSARDGAVADRYDADGFAVVPGLFDPAEIAEVREAL